MTEEQQPAAHVAQAQEERSVLKGFRIRPEEDQELGILTEYAFRTGHIKKATLQDFMVFALNCARSVLKAYEMRRKGLT